jgi:hypothetical protein
MSKWITTDNKTSVDVTPYQDDRDHGLGDECWCNPTVEATAGVPLVTHNKHKHTLGEWNDAEPVKIRGEWKIISIRFCSSCTKSQARIGTIQS